MTQVDSVLSRQHLADKTVRNRTQDAAGRSEGEPLKEEQGMPGVIIYEKPIALSELSFGPDTCAWVTDKEELVLASGNDYEQVLGAGKTACEKHGYKLYETVLEHPEPRCREQVESPVDVQE